MSKVNSDKYIGITNVASNNQVMRIVGYRNSHDIDIQFEDGTIVKNKSYSNFIRGRIANPNVAKSHLGEEINSKYGMKATIIGYRAYNDIDVQFEDGYIAKNVSYDKFIKDSILNKNIASNPAQAKNIIVNRERLGQIAKAKNGQMMTIIRYGSSSDIDVQFEDGTIVENKDYTNFIVGNIRNPNTFNRIKENNGRWHDRTGETLTAVNGQKMTIIRYGGVKDIDVQFEDGTIVYNKAYSNFTRGRIANPNIGREHPKLGMTIKNNTGLVMEIVDIKSGGKISVKFEDGTLVDSDFQNFKTGMIRSHSKAEKDIIIKDMISRHIGEKWKDSNGEEVTIIERVIKNDKPSDSYIVQWKDGQTLSTVYHNIKNAKFSRRNANKIGLTSKTTKGEVIKIIAYRNSHDLDVEFEDGTVVTNRCISDFYRGFINKESLTNKEFKDICNKLSISYEKVLSYKTRHKLSWEEAVVHFRPDCYINILGRLVICNV